MKKIKLLLALFSFFIVGAHYTCAYGVVPGIDSENTEKVHSNPDDTEITDDPMYDIEDLNTMYSQFLSDNKLCGSRLNEQYHSYYSGEYVGYVQQTLLRYHDLALINKRFDIQLQWYCEDKSKECCSIMDEGVPCLTFKLVKLSDIPKPLLENQQIFADLLMHFVEYEHRNYKKDENNECWVPAEKSQLIWFSSMAEVLGGGGAVSNTTEMSERYFLSRVVEADFTKEFERLDLANQNDTPDYFGRLIETFEQLKWWDDTKEVDENPGIDDNAKKTCTLFTFIKQAVSNYFPWRELRAISLEDCQRLINQVEKLQDPVLRKAILLPVVYTLENNPSYDEPWQQLYLAATALCEDQELISRFSCHMAHGSVWFSVFYHHYLKDLIRLNEKSILNELLKRALTPGITYYKDQLVRDLLQKGGSVSEECASTLLVQALSPNTQYVSERVSVLRKRGGILPKDVASELLEQALSPNTAYDSERVSVLRQLGGILPKDVASKLLKEAETKYGLYAREQPVFVLRELGDTLPEDEVSTREACGDQLVSQGQFTPGGFQATTPQQVGEAPGASK